MPPLHCFGEHRSQNWKHHGLDSIKGRSIIQYFNIFNQHDNSGVSLTVLLTAQNEFFTGFFFQSKFRGLFSHNLINCNCPRGSLKHFAPKHPAFSSFSKNSYYPAIISPRIYATISVMKNLQYYFPKKRGGGRRPFGFFPKIHPIW